MNSLVPLIAEVLKAKGKFNPGRLFGSTTLDVVRASTFSSRITGNWDPPEFVPVVGGHSTHTIVPLFSQSNLNFDEAQIKALTRKIQLAGDEVIDAKAGAGSAMLCMAYSAARFVFIPAR